MAAISNSPQNIDPLHEAWDRLITGKYAILSWPALEALYREKNETQFTLTSELVARCSFVAKATFQSSPMEAPKGIEQTTHPADKRHGLVEEIKLRSFFEKERFLTDEERIFISNDLCAKRSSLDELLASCVFVSKQIFDPKIIKKYVIEVNDGHPFIRKTGQLNTAIRNLNKFKEMNEKLDQEDGPIDRIYAIGVWTESFSSASR